MKYVVLKIINGSFSIDSEWDNNLNGAKTRFHGVCQTLWNAADVLSAYVMIADEQLDCVEGYKEYIHHEPVTPEPEPEEEQEEPGA